MRGRSFCFLVCLCVAMFGSAQASTITYTIVFTGTPNSLNAVYVNAKESVTPAVTPEPSGFILLGTGISSALCTRVRMRVRSRHLAVA